MNYAMVKAHYQNLLSQHYTWTFGDASEKYEQNLITLSKYLKPGKQQAIELGCGSGFQTIPLLKLGFNVYAIDSSFYLLEELKQEASKLKFDPSLLKTIEGDMLNFPDVCTENVDAIICMGDTITHLASLDEIRQLVWFS